MSVFSGEEAIPGADGTFFAQAKLVIPLRCWLLASLYGEVKLNPTTTIPNRVITGLRWKAETRLTDSSASAVSNKSQAQPFHLCIADAGQVLHTRNDGWPLVQVLVPQAGEFTFGALRTAAPPGEVTAALSIIRGVLIPEGLPPSELRALLRGGVW